MITKELLKGLAGCPPDALVVSKDRDGILRPVSGMEAKDIAQVDGFGCYPTNSLVLKGLVEFAGYQATYLPAAVMVL